jgi:hypothetical protein
MLLRIDPSQASLARTALEFVIFSKYPPSLAELAEATTVGSYDGPFDIGNRPFEPEDILRLCSSLLVVEFDLRSPRAVDLPYPAEVFDSEKDDESDSEASMVVSTTPEFDYSKPQIVKPAHYTVSEYIQSTRIRSSPAKFFAMSRDSGDASLAKICLKYLLIFNDPEPPCAIAQEEYALIGYAAKSWHLHVTTTATQHDTVTKDLLTKFLDTKGFCFLNCIRILDPDSRIYGDRKNLDVQRGDMFSPLYYLCRVGACCGLVKFAVDMGFDANQFGEFGSTLLTANDHCEDVNTLNF